MSEFTLSIPELFERAFNVNRGRPFQQPEEEAEPPIPEFEELTDDSQDGTEFLTVRNELNARLADGRLLFMPAEIGGVLLPNEPTMSFARPKRIVSTSMQGSKIDGEVKELMAISDYRIVIRGIAFNQVNSQFYPEDEVRSLIDLANRKEALEIRSALTRLHSVDRIVIDEIVMPEMVGVQHAQAYELRCRSDRQFQLEIT